MIKLVDTSSHFPNQEFSISLKPTPDYRSYRKGIQSSGGIIGHFKLTWSEINWSPIDISYFTS